MKAPSKLSAAELKKAINRANDTKDTITSEMIEAGRGYELSSETFKKSDPLSLRFIEASNALASLHREVQARLTYHGCTRPIKSTT